MFALCSAGNFRDALSALLKTLKLKGFTGAAGQD